MPDDEWIFEPSDSEYVRTYVPLNRSAKPQRSGATPEAKIAKQIDDYLKLLDFYVLRTSAGMAEIDGRTIALGRKGTHDRTCCAPNGRYVSIEIKSAKGSATPAQLRQREFIQRRQGVVIIPHSVEELRAGLVQAFGEQTVSDWETLGKARAKR